MFDRYDNLGFFNPFYVKRKNEIIVKEDFKDIIAYIDEPPFIDPLAVSQILNNNFIYGDRSIIKGIQRTPWMGKLDDSKEQWVYADLPNHYEKTVKETIIADEFFDRLCDEIFSYVEGKLSIGILLSGGMDSRIVAGVLDHLIIIGRLSNKVEVTGLTWGNDNSRDVIYAKKIAKALGWNWKHYKVTHVDIMNNINEVASNGCEFPPVHLHALPQIRQDNELDCVLAGSYGDSVGRAEYSSVNVEKLNAIDHNFRNVGSLLKQNVFKNLKSQASGDIDSYHKRFPQDQVYQLREQDYQLHYMRRMLNPCMKFIGNHNPLFQAFSSPDVFGYMWSLDPKLRNDNPYISILKRINPKLANIPWARTGLPFGVKQGIPDNYLKSHHSFKNQVDNHLYNEIKDLVLSDEIESLQIFNMGSLKKSLELIKSVEHTKYWYEEKLTWISALAKATEHYNIKTDCNYKISPVDLFNSKILSPLEFYGRNRNISKILKKI